MIDFFSALYELINYQQSFNSLLYGNDLYIQIGMVLVLSSIIFPLLFYYVLNHPRWNRFIHWLISMFLCLITNFLCSYLIINDKFDLRGYDGMYTLEIITFSFINLLWSFLGFTIFSFVIRWWSRNGSQTPFPL